MRRLLLLLLLPALAVAEWNPDRASAESVIDHLGSPDWKERYDAVKEVKARCLTEADPYLVDIARNDPHQKVRLVVLKAQLKCAMPSALGTAETVAMTDENAAVRNKAVRAIEKFGTEASVPVLVRVLDRDPDDGIRQKAATVLRKKRWAGAEPALERCAREGRAAMERVECTLALLGYDPDRWSPLLVERLGAEPDPKVKRELIGELRKRPVPQTRDALVMLLDDRDIKVRIDTAIALGRLGDPTVAPILIEKAAREYDDKVRETFLDVAAGLGG